MLKYIKITKEFLKNLTYISKVDITNEYKVNAPYTANKYYWLNEKLFNWTEKEIDDAVNGYIGTKYSIDCYITKPLQATSK